MKFIFNKYIYFLFGFILLFTSIFFLFFNNNVVYVFYPNDCLECPYQISTFSEITSYLGDDFKFKILDTNSNTFKRFDLEHNIELYPAYFTKSNLEILNIFTKGKSYYYISDFNSYKYASNTSRGLIHPIYYRNFDYNFPIIFMDFISPYSVKLFFDNKDIFKHLNYSNIFFNDDELYNYYLLNVCASNDENFLDYLDDLYYNSYNYYSEYTNNGDVDINFLKDVYFSKNRIDEIFLTHFSSDYYDECLNSTYFKNILNTQYEFVNNMLIMYEPALYYKSQLYYDLENISSVIN